ncbi:hypothetical protein DYB35_012859 [Aphanomyces astaci]|uniref:Uncharacterized protein n=1 Tax=Aphanomyces astaci TaxID=112090 RepID=A0A418DXZ9_APHAT|nr:hypothetical protein DYB35_012859 [Aphanomyces astaci]
MTGYSESSVREWIRDKPSLLGFQGSKTRKKNARPNGAKPIIPGSADLVTHLKDLRRDEKAVTSSYMMQFLRAGHMTWIQDYMATRASGYNSLLRLLQKFADRHGFSKQRVCRQKKPSKTWRRQDLLLANSFMLTTQTLHWTASTTLM